MTKRTIRELLTFAAASGAYLSEEKNVDTKLGYALRKVRKHIQKEFDKHDQLVEDLRVAHASIVEKHNLLKDGNNGFSFTREAQKIVNEGYRVLLEREVEIEPHFVTDFTGLGVQYRDHFDGIVIDEAASENRKGKLEKVLN